MKQVLVICGATATGKTALAAKCAKILQSAVISADSQLVYRGLSIGTAKPREHEMLGVPHYMIDVAEPTEDYSVSDYRDGALPIVERLVREKRVPVICGGTGFYINSLLYDFSYGGVAADAALREKYNKIAEEHGREYVYSLLAERDPGSAAKLHPNDLKRVVRALEICEAGGTKKSQLNDGAVPRYDFIAVAVDFPRQELYARIDARTDKMFEEGLMEEVESLLQRGIDESCRSMQAIGYKEVLEGLKNGYTKTEISELIKKNTRHYAKRQITFFKKMSNLKWLSPEEATAERILELLNE